MNNDRYFSNNQEINTPNIMNIKPNNNQEENIKPIYPNDTKEKKEPDDFVKSLPNWDLTPPYETVRRISRI